MRRIRNFPSRMKRRKGLGYIIGAILLLTAFWTGGEYLERQRLQRDIAEKLIRFHVVANSDTKEDQALKLQVRDAVGVKMQKLLEGVSGRAACEALLQERQGEIQQAAETAIAESGYDYKVNTFLKEVDFPVKSYGEYTFPAGTYEALEVVIGEGKGHNWWCVMYPNMCFSGSVYEAVVPEAEASLKETLSEEAYQSILSSGNYRVQFKYLTFLNKLSDGNEESY